MKPQNQSPAHTVQSIALSFSLAHTTQLSGPCISTKLTPLLHITPVPRRNASLLPLLCSYGMVIQQRDNFTSELDSGLRKVHWQRPSWTWKLQLLKTGMTVTHTH